MHPDSQSTPDAIREFDHVMKRIPGWPVIVIRPREECPVLAPQDSSITKDDGASTKVGLVQ